MRLPLFVPSREDRPTSIFGPGTLRSDIELRDTDGDFRQCGAGTRYELIWTPNPARLVYQGPIVDGPHAFVSPLPAVISAHKVGDRRLVVDVHDGDAILFAGYVWNIREGNRLRGDYPQLVLDETRDVSQVIAEILGAGSGSAVAQ